MVGTSTGRQTGCPVRPLLRSPEILPWPAQVDVVVVGGGIVGTSAALELVDQGLSVALCEKGGIGHEQSSRNWGWVRAGDRDERELPLMMHALDLWDSMHQRTGRDVGFVRSGITFAIHSDAGSRPPRTLAQGCIGTRRCRRDADGNRPSPTRSRTRPKPALAPWSRCCRAEPQKAAPAIAEAVRAKGGHILTGCAARGF